MTTASGTFIAVLIANAVCAACGELSFVQLRLRGDPSSGRVAVTTPLWSRAPIGRTWRGHQSTSRGCCNGCATGATVEAWLCAINGCWNSRSVALLTTTCCCGFRVAPGYLVPTTLGGGLMEALALSLRGRRSVIWSSTPRKGLMIRLRAKYQKAHASLESVAPQPSVTKSAVPASPRGSKTLPEPISFQGELLA